MRYNISLNYGQNPGRTQRGVFNRRLKIWGVIKSKKGDHLTAPESGRGEKIRSETQVWRNTDGSKE